MQNKAMLIVLMFGFSSIALAQTNAGKPTGSATKQESKAPAAVAKARTVALTWAQAKNEIALLQKKFEDPKLTNKQKIKFFPRSNEILSDIQDLKLSATEKTEQIKVVVEFIAAAFEADTPNSMTDTMIDDYQANKKAYIAAIDKLKDKAKAKEMKETFQSFAEVGEDNEG